MEITFQAGIKNFRPKEEVNQVDKTVIITLEAAVMNSKIIEDLAKMFVNDKSSSRELFITIKE